MKGSSETYERTSSSPSLTRQTREARNEKPVSQAKERKRDDSCVKRRKKLHEAHSLVQTACERETERKEQLNEHVLTAAAAACIILPQP